SLRLLPSSSHSWVSHLAIAFLLGAPVASPPGWVEPCCPEPLPLTIPRPDVIGSSGVSPLRKGRPLEALFRRGSAQGCSRRRDGWSFGPPVAARTRTWKSDRPASRAQAGRGAERPRNQ